MSIRQNIIRLRQVYEITQEELAEVAGVTRGAVSQWEGGFSEPRMGAIERIASHFNIMKSNIIEDGGMDLIDPITKRPRHPIILPGAIKPAPIEYVNLPILGRVHAGPFTEGEDLSERGAMLSVPAAIAESDPDTYLLEVEGDCMDRVYPEGCVIAISPNREPQSGSIAVVSIDGGEYVMRRMIKTANTLILAPESHNPEHKDIVIREEDDMVVSYAGKVVWFQASKELD